MINAGYTLVQRERKFFVCAVFIRKRVQRFLCVAGVLASVLCYNAAMKILAAVTGGLFLFLGLGWLHTFILTDFRQHYRSLMIPMGIFATIIGVAMIAWAIFGKRRK
jgi:hypothetical protein